MSTAFRPSPRLRGSAGPLDRITHSGIGLIFLSAIVEKWGFYFGFNLKFYEALVLLFLPVLLLHVTTRRGHAQLPSPLVVVLALKLTYLGLVVLSAFPLLINAVSPDSIGFFVKGVAQFTARTLWFVLLALVLIGSTEPQRRRLLALHVAGVTLSAVYGLLQGAALFQWDIDLDQRISDLLLPLTGSEGAQVARFAYGSFYRLPGLAGDPNLHAAYAITILPLLATLMLRRPSFGLGLLLVVHGCMFVFTMSLSGTVGLMISLAIVSLHFRPRLRIGHLAFAGIILAAAIAGFLKFEDQILHLVAVRTDPSGTATQHSEIARESLQIYRVAPWGVGYNNFSLAWRAFSESYPDRAMNPHNTFLAILVESGPLALLCELATYTLIVFVSLRQRTRFGLVFAATACGMAVAAFAYQTLEMFYAQSFLLLGFTAVVKRDSVWLDLSGRPPPPPSPSVHSPVISSG